METAKKQSLQKSSFRIEGMYCEHCQSIIEKKLKKTAGVHNVSVNYRTGAAVVTYDEALISFDKISEVIENLGYKTLDSGKNNAARITHIIATLAVIIILFMLMRTFTTSKLAAAFPAAKEGMSYGMLLVIGLLTSVHCVAMCGGINLSQTLHKSPESEIVNQESEIVSQEQEIANQETEGGKNTGAYSKLLPSFFYNSGRLISYTAVGVLVGALGSVISLSGHFRGFVQLAAGIFMLIMGINMLGLFPFLKRFNLHLPKIFSKKIDEQKSGRGPMLVGFLNGFMPCGPLQAMQLYALSTGSPIKGGISMFLFCIGTIPLMFALGAASSVLSGAKGRSFSRYAMQIGAVLVASLGLVMFSNGWSLSGLTSPLNEFSIRPTSPQIAETGNTSDSNKLAPAKQDEIQIIKSRLLSNRYPAITVKQNIPVRWIINVSPESINGCNYRMIIREYDIQHQFEEGDNVIEFTPAKAGRFRYSCWMGMIQSTITVTNES